VGINDTGRGGPVNVIIYSGSRASIGDRCRAIDSGGAPPVSGGLFRVSWRRIGDIQATGGRPGDGWLNHVGCAVLCRKAAPDRLGRRRRLRHREGRCTDPQATANCPGGQRSRRWAKNFFCRGREFRGGARARQARPSTATKARVRSRFSTRSRAGVSPTVTRTRSTTRAIGKVAYRPRDVTTRPVPDHPPSRHDFSGVPGGCHGSLIRKLQPSSDHLLPDVFGHAK